MFERITRQRFNAHGLKSLLKPVEKPNENLAIGGDDEMSDVPVVIYRGACLPQPTPLVEHIYNLPYEKTAKKGAGDTLSMEDFVTNDFDLGPEYDSLY